jgi:hypothetical protein
MASATLKFEVTAVMWLKPRTFFVYHLQLAEVNLPAAGRLL